jgi:hypothetical protein
MSHFAKLDQNNIVTFVSVGREEDEGKELELSERTGDVYKQTSYNSNIRKNFAAIGYKYDLVLDAFIPPKPYRSWKLDTETCLWEAPTPYPSEGLLHSWNEKTKRWDKII